MRNWMNVVAACAIAMTALAANTAAAEQRGGTEVEAVWKAQTILLDYRSAGRTYRCDILAHKIKTILQRVGANERLELKRFACRDLAGHARFEVRMRSPVEATPENVHALTQYDSRHELVARINGADLPSATDMERFPAVWSSVSFRKLDLDAGDCALVQQIRRQVLPLMSVEVLKDIKGVDCSQELTGIAGPRLVVLALVPVTASGHSDTSIDPKYR